MESKEVRIVVLSTGHITSLLSFFSDPVQMKNIFQKFSDVNNLFDYYFLCCFEGATFDWDAQSFLERTKGGEI
jgi:hypothetical protein